MKFAFHVHKNPEVAASGFSYACFCEVAYASGWLLFYFLRSNHLLMALAIMPAMTEERNERNSFMRRFLLSTAV